LYGCHKRHYNQQMIQRTLILWLLFTFTLSADSSPEEMLTLQHQMAVTIQPENGSITVIDKLTLPTPVSTLTIELNGALTFSANNTAQPKSIYQRRLGTQRIIGYRIEFAEPTEAITLRYAGQISNPLRETAALSRGGRTFTQGMIDAAGVYLSGSSYWYPTTKAARHHFSLQVKLPSAWRSISQGLYDATSERWISKTSQEEIFLIAGPYNVYNQVGPVAKVEAYLLSENAPLANRYIGSAAQWLSFYQQLLGPYPYQKFALVENHWQSGYGMPSFTLLGSRVIRLPFILFSSFPHEILHNWLGNGVYVDYLQGNWSEGLTSYLADHLIQEQQGRGSAYRRKALLQYANQVSEKDDFPIKSFTSHQGHHSQAIGYGKTMMFFHMLRRKIGDNNFVKGLQHFFKNQLFKTASFRSLQRSFETISKQPLQQFFEQWIERTGAPDLVLEKTKLKQIKDRFFLLATIEQMQTTAAYKLNVPYVVQFEDGTIEKYEKQMDEHQLELKQHFTKRPIRLLIDPAYDLFRNLHSDEIPSSFSQLFASKKLLIVLPSKTSSDLLSAYRAIAESWIKGIEHAEIIEDSMITKLPESDVWVFGTENKFKTVFTEKLRQKALNQTQGSTALVQVHGTDRQYQAGYLVLESSEAAPGMTRKLPHYGKYGYIQFNGDLPSVASKGEWMVAAKSMQKNLNQKIAEDLPSPIIPAGASLSPL